MRGATLAARGARLAGTLSEKELGALPASLDLLCPLDSISASRYGPHTQCKCGQEIEAPRCLGFFFDSNFLKIGKSLRV